MLFLILPYQKTVLTFSNMRVSASIETFPAFQISNLEMLFAIYFCNSPTQIVTFNHAIISKSLSCIIFFTIYSTYSLTDTKNRNHPWKK